MIQRFQTILLLFAAAANISGLFAPFWYASNTIVGSGPSKEMSAILYGKEIIVNSEDGIDRLAETAPITDHPFLLIHLVLVCLSSAFLLFLIFMFKNRPRQMMLTYIVMVVMGVQTLILILQSQKLKLLVGEAGTFFDEGPSWGYAAPLLTLMLIWWAARRIRKDEKLVKSMDRLR